MNFFLSKIGALGLILLLMACGPSSDPITEQPPVTATQRLDELAARMLDYLPAIPLDSTQIPRTVEDGQLKGTKSKSWTSGFFPGVLWQLYAHSQDTTLKVAAENWQAFVEKEKLDSTTHDLGFKLYCSFGQGWKNTQQQAYQDVFLTASNTLITRFNPTVGALRSWDHHADVWQFPVIIDNMMNLEMLFEASLLTGDSVYYRIADQHAQTTLKNHFRADNSSYHVVSYHPETGEVEKKNTHQGLSHESAWSRGQAWGLYGYTIAYKYTRRPAYLEQAKKIATYIFTHPNLPADLIPYWDYDAPNIPDEPRDVSAATVTSSALFMLSEFAPTEASQYLQWANGILTSLNQEVYQIDIAPFFLQHSVGSIPGGFEPDSPIIYADYYYVEALTRSKQHSQATAKQ